MKFIFEWKNYFTSERNERMKFFFHEKMNFISSSQGVIFFLLHRYECFAKILKNGRKTKEKKEMTSAISLLVKIWKVSHSYPRCSFVWKI